MINFKGHISPDKIETLRKTKVFGQTVKYFPITDSTNEEAKRCSDLPHGSLFVAEEQTNGKGRLGREWESEKHTGIYISLLLKPDVSLDRISQITLIAGIAVCRALGNDALIKWPNDIIIGTKKVCGILTEMSALDNKADFVICGIGINVNNTAFAAELKDKATSLFIETGKTHSREQIIAKVINEFEPLYDTFINEGISPLLDDYRSLCTTLNREVSIVNQTGTTTATAVDIDENGGLIIETENGKTTITSGEVSVRGLFGYV